MDSELKLLSPVGIAHACDLTCILAKAINLAGSTEQSKVRDALERVRNHASLIRDYNEPSTATRHDALSEADVFMARCGQIAHWFGLPDRHRWVLISVVRNSEFCGVSKALHRFLHISHNKFAVTHEFSKDCSVIPG